MLMADVLTDDWIGAFIGGAMVLIPLLVALLWAEKWSHRQTEKSRVRWREACLRATGDYRVLVDHALRMEENQGRQAQNEKLLKLLLYSDNPHEREVAAARLRERIGGGVEGG